MKIARTLVVTTSFLLLREASSLAAATVSTGSPAATAVAGTPRPLPPTKDVATRVAVAGATGRTGRLVVEELLRRGVPEVVALVRDSKKADEVFAHNENLKIAEVDLTDEEAIASALSEGVDAAIWCATGFSDARVSLIEKFKRLFGAALAPKRSVDAVGIPAVAKALLSSSSGGDDDNSPAIPKLVMMSSAGVTRPTWDDETKELLKGSAEIPIGNVDRRESD